MSYRNLLTGDGVPMPGGYFIYLFITTSFAKSIESIHRRNGAAREKLNPHLRACPPNRIG